MTEGQSLNWKPILVAPSIKRIKLRQGETVDQWFRRDARGVTRCICAPLIYSAVSSVGLWQTCYNGYSAALISVQEASAAPVFFVSVAESNTKAMQAASEKAHAHIVALVD